MMKTIYQIKTQSCLKALHQIGFDLQSIKAKYALKKFADSDISKADLFTSVLANQLQPAHVDYLNQKCALTYFKDKRTPVEYGIDLVLGWLIEDAVLQTLNKAGFKSTLDGNDRLRDFLSANSISAQPDIRIQTRSAKSLEVFADWRGTWRRYGHADLRDNKFLSLKNKRAYLLGISPIDSQGFLIDFSSESNLFTYVPSIKGYGGKSGYSCDSIQTKLMPLGDVISHLIEGLRKLN